MQNPISRRANPDLEFVRDSVLAGLVFTLELETTNARYSPIDILESTTVTGFTLSSTVTEEVAEEHALDPAAFERVHYVGMNVAQEYTREELGPELVQAFTATWLLGLRITDNDSPATLYDLGGSGLEYALTSGSDAVRAQGDDLRIAFSDGNDLLMESAQTAHGVHALMGKGDDTAYGTDGDDKLLGGRGEDSLTGGAGNDRIVGGAGADTLYGGDGNDRLLGKGNDDIMFGDAGNDRLLGGRGRDVLIAGEGDTGRDVISGGGGADAFVFLVNHGGTASGRTIIRDYNPLEDMLWAGPSTNGTWTAQEAFDYFTAGAEQVGDRVIYTDGDYSAVLLNTDLSDITQESFVDGPSGGYFAWADMG